MPATNARRRTTRSVAALTTAIAALASTASQAVALTINSWTNNVGDYSYGTANNWSNNNVPNSGDQATMYNGFSQLNGTPPSVGAVLLADVGSSSALDTNGFKLNVLGTVSLAGGDLEAASAPAGNYSVAAPTMVITGGGELAMNKSDSHVRVTGVLSVDGSSFVDAYGQLDAATYNQSGNLTAVFGSATVTSTTFTLAGTTAQPAAVYANGHALTINATTLELHDPNSNIDLSVANSTLNLNGAVDYTPGYIGANITVGDTSTLSFGGGAATVGYYSKSGANFIPHGNVTLNGGPTLARAATIATYCEFFSNVNVTGYGNLPAAEFDGGADVTAGAGSFLYLNGPYFRGGATSPSITFGGTGQYVVNGAMQIGYSGTGIPYTTVNVNAGTVFDWDGTSESTASCSITNGELDIYSSTIDVAHTIFQPLGYNGALSVTGGATLNVAGTAWTLYGTMALSPGALVQGQTLTLDGSSLPAGTYSLSPSSSGTTFPVIQAPVVINPNTYIYMGFTGGLHLDGPTTWAGGAVISAPFVSGNPPYGTLVQDGNATVTANTNIFCGVLDMDGAANTATWTINPGVQLYQNAYSLDAAGSTSNPFHSTLTLNGGTINMSTGAGVWTLAGGTINMNQVGFNFPYVYGDKLILGSGSAIGTINMGANTIGEVLAPLQSNATTVAGGNVVNVGTASALVVSTFYSNTNAVLTKTGPGLMEVLYAQGHAAGAEVIVQQGELALASDAGAAGANLNIDSIGGLTSLNVTQHLASLTIGTGATVVVPTRVLPNPRTVIVTTLNMSGGTLDMTTSDMICHNASLAGIWQNTQAGYNHGNWNGAGGILSSTAASDTSHLYALGVILNKNSLNQPIYPNFDSQTSVTTDVLIKYTYYGDANLDGKVDGSDYSLIDNGYAAHGSLTGWFNGDFNYDGVVDGSDYTLLDNAFNNQTVNLGPINAAYPSNQVAGPAVSAAAVPEPASVAAICVAIAGVAVRRRRGR